MSSENLTECRIELKSIHTSRWYIMMKSVSTAKRTMLVQCFAGSRRIVVNSVL